MRDDVEALPPGALPVGVGDVLAGKYRVERVLGVGGMGVVVAAHHLQLDQRVALKFMLPEALSHATLVERFAREARAAARLKSDHVARVLDVGTLESGSPYMVMEYLEGSDLATVIERRGPMPIEMAVDCVLQACDAVAEAHAVGIVHRDLKPRNLFLTSRNDGGPLVKVLDFGISKHAGPGDLSLTRSAEIIGSPNYMSPEQLKSARHVDARTDVWALGVILYELLTGQVPFVAESVTELIMLVLSERPRPLDSLRAEVPIELRRLIERCLEKDPARRLPSVAALALALQPFAPADSRQLALRIARIGPEQQRSLPPAPAATAVGAAAGTDANWTESERGAATSQTRRAAAIGGVTLLAAAVAAGVATTLLRRSAPGAPIGSAAPTNAPAGAADTAAVRPPAAAPTASFGRAVAQEPSALPTIAPPPSTTPVALDPGPASASATRPASSAVPAARRPGLGRAPVSPPVAPSASDEAPRYRTTW